MWSLASGWRVDVLFLRDTRGEDRRGEAGRIDLLGSSAKERAFDATLLCASTRESTRDLGPKEKDELIEWRERDPEGDGSLGMDGILKLLAGGGVDVILSRDR